MNYYKKLNFLFLFICALIAPSHLCAQSNVKLNVQVDSVMKANNIVFSEGKLEVDDSVKLKKLINQMSDLIYTNTKMVEKVTDYVLLQLNSKKLDKHQNEILNAYRITNANCNILLANYDKARKGFENVLTDPRSSIKNRAKAEANIGIIFYSQENYSDAAKHYLSSIEYCKKNNLNYSNQLVNLCLIYENLKNIDKQLEYGFLGLELAKKFDDTISLEYVYNSLGLAFKDLKKTDKAIFYFKEALRLADLTKTDVIIADVSENMGIIYMDLGNFDESEKYFNIAIKYNIIVDRKSFSTFTNIIKLYTIQKNYSKVKEFITLAELSIEPSTPLNYLYEFYLNKSEYFSQTNDFKSAYKDLSKAKVYLDSMAIEANNNDVRNLEQDYAIREMRLSDSLEFAIKEKSIKEKNQLNTEKKNAQLKLQKGILIFSVAFALLLLATIFYVFKMYKTKKQANEIIEVQKDLAEQQKAEISEKNKELTDSINYAKNLQDALIPSEKFLQDNFEDIGLIYYPKDIVSGDFYWTYKDSENIYLAVADCTGHGVPGAMVSIIGINSLERCVKENLLTEPDEILNQLNNYVEATFSTHNYDINDGMDISLIKFNLYTRNISFAGAYNPLWIFSDQSNLNQASESQKIGENYLSVFAANKQPIGKFRNRKPFDKQQFILPPNSTICLLTDGLADQFGGSQQTAGDKKIKNGPIRKTISENIDKSASEICSILKSLFFDWKGNNDQIDDVTLIIWKL